jgi:ABC-type dipeptide/oligopeptide/nickel transport system permease component
VAVYVAKRILTSLLVFLGITMLVFVLVRQVPGDPVRMMINPVDAQHGGEAFIRAQRHRLGLDLPVPVQYVRWLQGLLHGDLGFSFRTQQAVTQVVGERLPATAELMGAALLVSLLVGLPVGALAAVRHNRLFDRMAAVLSMLTVSTPTFFLGLAAIYLFSVTLGWLPSAGIETPGVGTVGDRLSHLVLPALILGLGLAGPLVRYVRAALLEELGKDYLRVAAARGASPLRVVVRHGLRNSLIPLITVLAIQIPLLAGGAVIVEQVFGWPGMGQLTVEAIQTQDYPVIVGFTLVVAALVLLCNFVADLLYGAADPRVRLR